MTLNKEGFAPVENIGNCEETEYCARPIRRVFLATKTPENIQKVN